MTQLRLSWLGLSWEEAFPLLFLLLGGVTWFLIQILKWIYSFYEYYSHLRCFPQPPKWNWLSGHLGMVPPTEQGLKDAAQLVATYPQGFLMWKGPMLPIVTLCHPDNIQCVLSASAEVADKDIFAYNFLKPWLGDGLLLIAGHKWSHRRRLLTPSFHFHVLKPYVKIFRACTNVMLAKWQCLASEGSACLDMFEHISLLTLDTLQKCVFSFESNCQENWKKYILTISELSALVTKRIDQPHLHRDSLYHLTRDGQRFQKICEVLKSFTDAVMLDRCRTIVSLRTKTLNFMDVLLLCEDEDGKALPLEDLRGEAATFMFKGYETTASGLSWALYNLARHPEYQERCRQEVRELLRGRGPEEIEWEDLAQLPFLTMCIKESLRLHPPVTDISRCCTQDVVLPDGRVIPKGVTCLISIFGLHHNPAVWPDPEVYDPFRFDPENSKDRSPLAFIPFSAGPRNCIGQTFAMAEMKVVLALTLLRFRVLPDATEPRRKPELILRAEGGLWLRVEPLS
ncbi:leukotriene-B4 omega-hydroxylase 3 isoform X1 [Fukomys damarensis]|uniref:Leukotriene-B4 omega-hydroxylase 3 n=1 Tax=Fukomys damarensis TaxID=885580 RepID=A0A091E1I3_FUKDA|nr:leukotriene-B4 omega-hydroxylase 3 isoform X1 [Fukomys damarensis]KFO28941.1 Leukotriene-B4 omega-hydroxylase 3 [Fukomys damarensis]